MVCIVNVTAYCYVYMYMYMCVRGQILLDYHLFTLLQPAFAAFKLFQLSAA